MIKIIKAAMVGSKDAAIFNYDLIAVAWQVKLFEFGSENVSNPIARMIMKKRI